MVDGHSKQNGPDLVHGILLADLPDGGQLVGHCGGEPVLLVRRGGQIFAVDAHCTHYNGPLSEGIVVEDTIRCPWHHACFDLRTGEALRAPAFRSLACWWVEQRNDKVFVVGKRRRSEPSTRPLPLDPMPERIVIVGGGAAGFAAAEKLRREQFQGSIVMLSDDDAPPIDRPNLSKEYLSGKAPKEWLPLQGDSFFSRNNIDLRLKADVTAIDVQANEVVISNSERLPYDRLLLATGAEPLRLSIPGADQPHVHTLRSLSDCNAIIEQATTAKRVVVFGAGFIGLEVAASLRNRNVEVHVVAPNKRPLQRVLGAELGDFLRDLHEKHGVVFHLENTPVRIDRTTVTLASGHTLTADVFVAGIGVRPRTRLAENAGLAIDRGVVVDVHLQTSAPGIFAAGDIARWPDPRTGDDIRVEHWVVAEMQGQTAAMNMLGYGKKFTAVPFFWSTHFDVPINYVGHAERWDEVEVQGEIANRDCLIRYKRGGRTLAVASIFRDIDSLTAEVAMELSTNGSRD